MSNSISALSTVPAGSIGDGGASIIRQNIGSGKKDRALKVFKSVFLVDVAWGTLGFYLHGYFSTRFSRYFRAEMQCLPN